MSSSGALKVAAGSGDGNGLVHDPFADTEVLVDPSSEVLVFTGNFVPLETGSRRSRNGFESDMLGREGSRLDTHVKPVDRFIPARKAETMTG